MPKANDDLPDPDRPDQSLDARHILQKREGGEETRDHCSQCLC